jgi:hypothetical protein
MRQTQLVAALLVCAAISLSRAGSAQTAAPTPLVVEDAGPPYTTALGYQAAANTSGPFNTASGYEALYANTTGAGNTASGDHALFSNTTGSYNTASGAAALFNNTTAGFNTASGAVALNSNTTGGGNTASGYGTLHANTTGGSNTALGINAGSNATTGYYNLFLGAFVEGTASDTNTIRLGLPYDGTNGQNQTFIAGIYGTPITNGLPVVINASGQLGIAALPVTFIAPRPVGDPAAGQDPGHPTPATSAGPAGHDRGRERPTHAAGGARRSFRGPQMRHDAHRCIQPSWVI